MKNERKRNSSFRKYTTFTLSASSDSFKFLSSFKKWVNEQLSRKIGVIYTRNQQGKLRHKLVFCGNVSAVQVACLLYDNHTIAMERKIASYKQFVGGL